MKVKLYVGKVQDRFYYVDIGSELHGKKSFRLWLSHRLIQRGEDGEYIEFPLPAHIHQTEKGSLVAKPDPSKVVHYIFVEGGYRGRSFIEIEEPKDAMIYRFYVFRSPRGNLGVDEGMLVEVNRDTTIIYKYELTGRLYGRNPRGRIIVKPTGEEEPLPPEEVESELKDESG